MITVGFYKGHNATACIQKDGKIIAAVSEERFNRIKNSDVFPTKAIEYCLKEAGIKANQVDLYIRTYKHAEGFVTASGETKLPLTLIILNHFLVLARKLIFLFPGLSTLASKSYNLLYSQILSPIYQNKFKSTMSQFLGVDKNKIIFADHHTCHAYAAYYGFVPRNLQMKEDFLVITLDGAGDGDCGGIWLVKKGKWTKLATTPAGNSLALFYGQITQYLGMKLNEHEYKIMGLAPYVSDYEIKKVYPLFKDLFKIDENLVMHSKILSSSYLHYFDKVLKRQRFDGVAGAAQKYIEEIVIELVSKAIKKTGVKNIVVGGGFFMNVKANKRIQEQESVNLFFPCPSAADESTVFGAAIYGYQKLEDPKNFKPENIENLYLGPEFSNQDIKKLIDKTKINKKYKIKKINNIEKEVARLLASGKIIAWFQGRMEWGARALGNRSILMDPRHKELVQKLNSQIKSRDFWMPFAASILDTFSKKYLINKKKIDAKFMIIAFDTTVKGQKDLAAAIHPYDATCRPQIISGKDNKKYYNLIKNFQKITGVGGLLNTSFNYHGEPIVCSPEDALHTFESTGLEYLVINDYLFIKNETK